MEEGRLPLSIKDPLLLPYWLPGSLSHTNKHKQKLNNISCVYIAAVIAVASLRFPRTLSHTHCLLIEQIGKDSAAPHCTLHIAHCTLRMGIAHCTVRIAHYVLCTARYTLQLVPYTLRLDWTKREGLSDEG